MDKLTKEEYYNLDDAKAPVMMSKTIRRIIKEENWAAANAAMPLAVPRVSFYTKHGKRILDIFLSFFALLITLPVNLFLLICTFFDVGRPVFFSQERIGKDMKPFVLTKFRNMNNKTNEHGEPLPAYMRVTRFGSFVRRTSLDELLNFWSIFKGDMSVIGPRPLPQPYIYSMTERHRQRYLLRPGLECPDLHPEADRTWSSQFDNDVWYLENVSLRTDIKLFFALVKAVFDRKSTAIRGNAQRGSFMGYEKDGSSIVSRMIPIQYVKKAQVIYDSDERDEFTAFSYMCDIESKSEAPNEADFAAVNV